LGLAFNGGAVGTLRTITISNPFSGDPQPSGTLDSRTIVILNDPGTTIVTSVTAYVSDRDWNNTAFSTNDTGPITVGTTAAAIRR
jgi:hypothetical protein